MKKISLTLSLILILSVFVYWLIVISNNNTCTSVRSYNSACKK